MGNELKVNKNPVFYQWDHHRLPFQNKHILEHVNCLISEEKSLFLVSCVWYVAETSKDTIKFFGVKSEHLKSPFPCGKGSVALSSHTHMRTTQSHHVTKRRTGVVSNDKITWCSYQIFEFGFEAKQEQEIFQLSKLSRLPVQPTQPHYSTGTGGSFCCGKAAGSWSWPPPFFF